VLTTSPTWSGPARRVKGLVWADPATHQPGDYDFAMRRVGDRDYIGCVNIVCPGCGTLSALQLRKPSLWPGVPNKDWHWDGDEAAPTLSPSIHHVGCWHGHLKKGRFESC